VAPGARLVAEGSLGLCSVKGCLGAVLCLARYVTAGQHGALPRVMRSLNACRSAFGTAGPGREASARSERGER